VREDGEPHLGHVLTGTPSEGAKVTRPQAQVTELSGPSKEVLWPSVTAALPRSTGTSITTPPADRRVVRQRAKRPMTPSGA
jgi:hypothetical protein